MVAGLAVAMTADGGLEGESKVNVTGLEKSATWQYSIDNGTNWTEGAGTSFLLAADSYADGAVQVRQTDVAGNVSDTTHVDMLQGEGVADLTGAGANPETIGLDDLLIDSGSLMLMGDTGDGSDPAGIGDPLLTSFATNEQQDASGSGGLVIKGDTNGKADPVAINDVSTEDDSDNNTSDSSAESPATFSGSESIAAGSAAAGPETVGGSEIPATGSAAAGPETVSGSEIPATGSAAASPATVSGSESPATGSATASPETVSGSESPATGSASTSPDTVGGSEPAGGQTGTGSDVITLTSLLSSGDSQSNGGTDSGGAYVQVTDPQQADALLAPAAADIDNLIGQQDISAAIGSSIGTIPVEIVVQNAVA